MEGENSENASQTMVDTDGSITDSGDDDGWSFSSYEEPVYVNTPVYEKVRCPRLCILACVFMFVIVIGMVGGSMWIMHHFIFDIPNKNTTRHTVPKVDITILPKTECHHLEQERLTTPREISSTWIRWKSDERSPCAIKIKAKNHEV